MRQVFQNLIDNAVKYMGDKPEKRITLSYSGDKHAHTFALADTGQGISEEDLPRVFDVFRRATKSGPLLAEGRGVGLANVKSIIETYGGQITPTSSLGAGTTFTFSFNTRHTTPPAAMQAA
jgi:signal transduction histidine kinase